MLTRKFRVSIVATSTPIVPSNRLSRPATVAYSRSMQVPPEDSALMLQYKDGDIAAFETLYRRHNAPLYRYLLRLCLNRDSAEDVFQDTWGKIINARQSYRPTAGFRTFLFRVAHNCFIDYLRRNKRHIAPAAMDPDQLASDSESPELGAEKSLARARLNEALKSLPLEQRDVFLLHEESGLSIEHIAYVTDVNRETAKSRLRYAVKKLRAALSDPAEDLA